LPRDEQRRYGDDGRQNGEREPEATAQGGNEMAEVEPVGAGPV
jgi:hypothetical protein